MGLQALLLVPDGDGSQGRFGIRTIAEQAAKTDAIVDEALAAGLGRRSDPITVHVKMLRQELLD